MLGLGLGLGVSQRAACCGVGELLRVERHAHAGVARGGRGGRDAAQQRGVGRVEGGGHRRVGAAAAAAARRAAAAARRAAAVRRVARRVAPLEAASVAVAAMQASDAAHLKAGATSRGAARWEDCSELRQRREAESGHRRVELLGLGLVLVLGLGLG